MTKQEKLGLKIKIEDELLTLNKNILDLEEFCEPIKPECALGDLTRFELINEQVISEKTLKLALIRQSSLKLTLKNIDNLEYGLCRDCEEEIPYARLLLMPESIYCIKCAREQSS